MILQSTQDRLKAQVPTLKLVDGAAALSEIKNNPAKQPAAYVIPISERGGVNAVATAVRQEATARIGVLTALGNLKDKTGDTATQQLEALLIDIRTALVGWPPATGFEAYLYASGRVIEIRNRVVWHLSEFTTQFYISA
ncbi:MAG: hypothetical protein HQ494_08875 [Rhodospirillales bacterium]|nr:hypothetical protein [Rhodospirillales bacterium]